MRPHVTPLSPGPTAGPVPMRTLHALDLTTNPAHRGLWRGAGAPTPDAGARAAGLPAEGAASPLGFWLTTEGEGVDPAAPRILFQAPGPVPLEGPKRGRRPPQTVKLRSPIPGDGELTLTLGPDAAQIACTPGAWATLEEPVVLACCQYWRFLAIDAEIDRLTESAKLDLRHATMPGLRTLRDGGRLTVDAHAVRVLMLDLPYFEGTLTDPYPYCTTERAAVAFEALAEKLRLEEWCELIDERAEAIEDAYESASEKLFEFKNFAWEAALEIGIIVILLAELGLQVWESFGP